MSALNAAEVLLQNRFPNLTGVTPVSSNFTPNLVSGPYASAPTLSLGNGAVHMELPETVTDSWTLRVRAQHPAYQSGLFAGVFNADGKQGYAVRWNGALSTQYSGTGAVDIRKYGLATEVNYGMAHTTVTNIVTSGHLIGTSQMALIELSWDAPTRMLTLRVNGVVKGQNVDTSYSSFKRVYLIGHNASHFDDVEFVVERASGLTTMHFEDNMANLSKWTANGTVPVLKTNTYATAPAMQLGDGSVRAEVPQTVRGNWTLRLKAQHPAYNLGMHFGVLNQAGTQGYGVAWNASGATQWGGKGFVSLRRFDSTPAVGEASSGVLLGATSNSGHTVATAQLAEIELSWEAASRTLYLRVNGLPKAQVTDSTYSEFRRIYLVGDSGSIFDDVEFFTETPPTSAVISQALNLQTGGFGAVGDGVFDNQTAITNALAAARAQGKPLYVPPGVYRHSNVIDLQGASILGMGYISRLAASNNIRSTVRLTGTGVFIRSLNLASTNPATRDTTPQATAIHLENAHNFEVSNCHVVKTGSAGIIASSTRSTNGLIAGNWVSDTMADGIHLTVGSRDITIANNRVRRTGDDFIAVVNSKNQAGHRNERILIIDNDVADQSWGRGIACVGGREVTIQGNTIARSAGAGIMISSESPKDTYGCNDVQVLDNYITDTTLLLGSHGGIHISGRAGDIVEDVLIENNTLVNARTWGVRFVGYVSNSTLQNNTVAWTAKAGAEIGGNVQNLSILDNEFAEIGGTGVYSGTNAGSGLLAINGNTFVNINTVEQIASTDVIHVASGSQWGSVEIKLNVFTNPGNYLIHRFIQCDFAGPKVITGNTPSN